MAKGKKSRDEWQGEQEPRLDLLFAKILSFSFGLHGSDPWEEIRAHRREYESWQATRDNECGLIISGGF